MLTGGTCNGCSGMPDHDQPDPRRRTRCSTCRRRPHRWAPLATSIGPGVYNAPSRPTGPLAPGHLHPEQRLVTSRVRRSLPAPASCSTSRVAALTMSGGLVASASRRTQEQPYQGMPIWVPRTNTGGTVNFHGSAQRDLRGRPRLRAGGGNVSISVAVVPAASSWARSSLNSITGNGGGGVRPVLREPQPELRRRRHRMSGEPRSVRVARPARPSPRSSSRSRSSGLRSSPSSVRSATGIAGVLRSPSAAPTADTIARSVAEAIKDRKVPLDPNGSYDVEPLVRPSTPGIQRRVSRRDNVSNLPQHRPRSLTVGELRRAAARAPRTAADHSDGHVEQRQGRDGSPCRSSSRTTDVAGRRGDEVSVGHP